jgi:hypothetical protein
MSLPRDCGLISATRMVSGPASWSAREHLYVGRRRGWVAARREQRLSDGYRRCGVGAELEPQQRVVVQVGADAGRIGHDVDAERPQIVGRSDAGPHQNGRTSEGACAQHHRIRMQRRPVGQLHPDRTTVAQQ